MVKISVIVPVYNVEYYVEEALDSLVNQTIFNDIEIIIVDDGSTDNSRYIIERYAIDYDNIFVFHKENEGLSVARNFGMEHAKGKYIHFFDSDDFILYDALENLYNLAEKDDYDVVAGPFLRFNSEKTWQWTISRYVYENITETIENIRLEDYTNLVWDTLSWNKIYRKEFLDKNNIKYVEGLRFQDILFLMEVFYKASKIGVIPNFVSCWRVREDNSSSTQTFDMIRVNNLITVTYLLDKFLKENVDNKEILANKYLKWLILDIRVFIEMIPKYPKEDQEFLLETTYNFYNMIPKEYTKNLNSHFTVMYEILENKDWDNLLLFSSIFYKNNPKLPEGLDEKYAQKIDFKNDALGEDLDIYVLRLSNNDEDIIIDFGLTMPYISNEEDYRIKAKVVNSKHEMDLDEKYIERTKLRIPADLLEFGESSLLMTYELDFIKKESLMKTVFRKTFSYDSFDVDIARGNASNLRIIKRERNDIDYLIREVNLEGNEFIEFKGISNDCGGHILIKDYLDFSEFRYQTDFKAIDDDKYEFTFKIPYKDLLKAPVKKWDFYVDGKFNRINLEKNHEFLNRMYRIYLKNYGNRFVIEFYRYDSLETISKLNDDKKKLENNNKELKNDNRKLENNNKELKNDNRKLENNNKELEKKNKKLKRKIKQYKSRKVVRLVDSLKELI